MTKAIQRTQGTQGMYRGSIPATIKANPLLAEFVTPAQAALALKISRQHVLRRIASNKIPHIAYAGHWFIPRTALQEPFEVRIAKMVGTLRKESAEFEERLLQFCGPDADALLDAAHDAAMVSRNEQR